MTSDTELAIWRRLFEPSWDQLSPEAARSILDLKFGDADQERIEELAAKSNQGTLTPGERDEYELYVRVGNLLALMHAKARRAVKRTGISV